MVKGMTLPSDATHELKNLTTHEVSLVDMPANKRPFLVVKSASAEPAEPDLRSGLVAGAKKLAAMLGGDNLTASAAQTLGRELLLAAGLEVTDAPSEPTAVIEVGELPVKDALKAIADAVETKASEPVDPVADILDEATKAIPPSEFDQVIQEAQLADLQAELALVRESASVEKAELGAKLAFMVAEHEQALADSALVAKSSDEKVALTLKAQEALQATLVAKDAEIAALTTKLEESALALAKAQKLSRSAPQTIRAASLLRQLAKGDQAAGQSQAIPSGETPEKTDPWEDSWDFNE